MNTSHDGDMFQSPWYWLFFQYHNFVFVCINNSAIVWLSISYAYKGLLQILAMFMAFHTRKVKIKALNDSKEITIIIYINSITLSLLALVEFALNVYHEVYAALFGLALWVGATLFLTLHALQSKGTYNIISSYDTVIVIILAILVQIQSHNSAC